METSLHRQLKLAYAVSAAHTEVSFAAYRIDAIGRSNELVEIQHASLGALKSKIRRLLDHDSHRPVRVVKPIVARKWIVTRQSPTGPVLRKRLSPKRGQLSDIFLDLVHFTALFPHPRLTLEVLLVNTEEERVAKAKHRFRRKNYVTLQQTLVSVEHRLELRQACDLWRVLPLVALPESFDTAELARQIERPRWFAQKVAYCLRNCQTIRLTGKRGNNQLYTKEPLAHSTRPAPKRKRPAKKLAEPAQLESAPHKHTPSASTPLKPTPFEPNGQLNKKRRAKRSSTKLNSLPICESKLNSNAKRRTKSKSNTSPADANSKAKANSGADAKPRLTPSSKSPATTTSKAKSRRRAA